MLSRFLFLEITSPTLENTLSQGANEAGVHPNCTLLQVYIGWGKCTSAFPNREVGHRSSQYLLYYIHLCVGESRPHFDHLLNQRGFMSSMMSPPLKDTCLDTHSTKHFLEDPRPNTSIFCSCLQVYRVLTLCSCPDHLTTTAPFLHAAFLVPTPTRLASCINQPLLIPSKKTFILLQPSSVSCVWAPPTSCRNRL